MIFFCYWCLLLLSRRINKRSSARAHIQYYHFVCCFVDFPCLNNLFFFLYSDLHISVLFVCLCWVVFVCNECNYIMRLQLHEKANEPPNVAKKKTKRNNKINLRHFYEPTFNKLYEQICFFLPIWSHRRFIGNVFFFSLARLLSSDNIGCV